MKNPVHRFTSTRRNFTRGLGLAALAAPFSFAGCAAPEAPAANEEVRSSKSRLAITATAADASAVATAQNAFAAALAKAVRGQPGNQVTSPISIALALGMTGAGARGETAAEMARVLAVPNLAELHRHMNLVDSELGQRGQGFAGSNGGPFTLRLANRVWAQKGMAMEPPFLDTLAEHYGAGVGVVDFRAAPEPARVGINGWVRDRTEGHIPELLPADAIQRDTRIVLTNAVYLNAAWLDRFNPNDTFTGDFTRVDGSTSRVELMSRRNGVRDAARGPGWVAAALPYQDTRLELVLVVPDAGQLATFEDKLDGPMLSSIFAALAEHPNRVVLPRLRFGTSLSLKAALRAMGLDTAFTGAADFSGITGGDTFAIADVIHQATIAVGEKGTEAAAATAVNGTGAAPPPRDPIEVIANRPFHFYLRDKPTGAIVFMGRVLDPAK